MVLKHINHLAFITPDLEGTIRFYRDLLGMKLEMGFGSNSYRHYFFKTGPNHIAFFTYPDAAPMEYEKFHGSPTSAPIGYDHVSMDVDAAEDLFYLKEKLEAAGIKCHGPMDHGFQWSLYFFDPINNIPLEAAYNTVELVDDESGQAIDDADADAAAVAAALEGCDPQPGHWPDVARRDHYNIKVKRAGGFDFREKMTASGHVRKRANFPAQFKVVETVEELDLAD
jgi:catechol 2,3-dioxygenase-like lactoylglutathione lyase family enzyme